MITKKETMFVFLFLITVVIIFVPEIAFFKKGFLGGDYGQQFYPYGAWYGEQIKNFKSPFYTQSISCGYSLLGEAQSGIFYPVNAMLFFALPVKIAYQLNPLIHFILGGFFSYIFIRNKGISTWGGLIFALIFMFGANVCGISYNTVVQKVLVWFPLGLYCIDRFFSSRKYRFLSGLAIVFVLQTLAGFLQISLYCIGFSALYFLIKLFSGKSHNRVKDIFIFSVLMIAVFAVSLPQLIPTVRSVALSTRAHQDPGFSLWGSTTPFVPLGLVLPSWQNFVGGNMYGGAALIPLIVLFFKYGRQAPRDIKICSILFLVSFICALGAYTPIMPLLIKLFHLSFIRKPSKFLFISNFFLTACCMWSLDDFIKRRFDKTDVRFVTRSIAAIILISLFTIIATNVILNGFGDQIISWGKNYINAHVYGKSYHRYTLDEYYQRALLIPNALKDLVSFSNIHNWIALLLLLMTLFVFRAKRHFKTILLGFVFLDLLAFSQYSTGLKGNFIEWKKFLKEPGYIQFLKNDKDDYRIYNFLTKETARLFYEDYHLMENENMLYGISSVGLYAPIVNSEYYELLKDTGAIDDSLGRTYSDIETLKKNLGLLASLNVKYILSFDDLSGLGSLEEVYREGVLKVYRLTRFMPRAFFVKNVKIVRDREEVFKYLKSEGYDPGEYLVTDDASYDYSLIGLSRNCAINIVCNENEKMILDIEADSVMSLVAVNIRSTDWEAFLDNKKIGIHRLNLILPGVIIPQGKHRLEFRHRPYFS